MKTVPAVVALPGPRSVPIRDLPKVFLFIPKAPQSRCYFNLNFLDIDPNCYIPDYFDDFLTLAWLAFLIPDQTKEPTPTRKEIEDMDEDDVMEIAPAQFTPRKRRAIKVKEQLDEEFLRRSKRNAVKRAGFKTPQKKRSTQEDVLEPVPLAMILASPSTTPAPYLTKEVIEGIATGFLQIHPSDVSVAIL